MKRNGSGKKGVKFLTRRKPAQWTHRAVICATLVRSELRTKVGQREETVRVVEELLVFAVTSFYLAVMPRGIWPNELVADAKGGSSRFKEGGHIPVPSGKTVGKLEPVVCLDAFHGHAATFEPGKCLAQEIGGGICALFRVSAEIPEAGILVDRGILEKAFFWVCKAAQRNDLDVDLDPLTRMIHLFIGLRFSFLLFLWRREHPELTHDPVQALRAAGIASFAKSVPELYHSEIRVSAAHTLNERDLLGRVFIGMMMRASGLAGERGQRTVPALAPKVDIGAGTVVLSTGPAYAKFCCIQH